MNRLRMALPPLAELTPHSRVEFAWLDRSGQPGQSGYGTLQAIVQGARVQAVECYLHPLDSVLTAIELPPLSTARTADAVACAAQALILGGSDTMHIAHSARDVHGQVHLAWLPRLALERLDLWLGQYRSLLRGLYPAPYRLPVPPAGAVSACVLEGQLLLRFAVDRAALEPLPGDRLDELRIGDVDVHWFGEGAPAEVSELPDPSLCWSGQAPPWGLHGALGKRSVQPAAWGRALLCCALAVGVWGAGLNLYAARQAAQGQQLKAALSQRVRQAFPELPVILNPLQQARQQLAARHSGGATDATAGFDYLVRQAANGLPALAGSVRRLTFAEGRLQLELLPDLPQPGSDSALQAALAQVGVAGSREGGVWSLSPLNGNGSDAQDSSREYDDEQ